MTPTRPTEHAEYLRRYRIRVLLFLAAVFAIILILSAFWQFVHALARLDVVESDRDRWQRPADVVRALDLHPGGTAVDLGSGAGYFSLKLSTAVGASGRVFAVDLRRLPLFFLAVRSRWLGLHNITVIRSTPGGLWMPPGRANALLVANAYHEFDDRRAMLARISQSLLRGGRLVILDRPSAPDHRLPFRTALRELLDAGFVLIESDENFIRHPDDGSWYLIVCQR